MKKIKIYKHNRKFKDSLCYIDFFVEPDDYWISKYINHLFVYDKN